jgi:hypothetical protein
MNIHRPRQNAVHGGTFYAMLGLNTRNAAVHGGVKAIEILSVRYNTILK